MSWPMYDVFDTKLSLHLEDLHKIDLHRVFTILSKSVVDFKFTLSDYNEIEDELFMT